MAIIIVAVLFGMVLAMPTNLAQRRRDRRQQKTRNLSTELSTATATPDGSPPFLADEDVAQFVRQRARIIARARESQSWSEAKSYVRTKFQGAERRQLVQDIVREEIAYAELISQGQKILIRDPKFRKDLSTLLQYTAMSGRWEEARAHVRKVYTGARKPVVLHALAQAEATAKALGESQPPYDGQESETCASPLPEKENT